MTAGASGQKEASEETDERHLHHQNTRGCDTDCVFIRLDSRQHTPRPPSEHTVVGIYLAVNARGREGFRVLGYRMETDVCHVEVEGLGLVLAAEPYHSSTDRA